MGLELNLHITATNLKDFKEQVKAAYEGLFGSVVETPKENTKKAHQEEIAKATKSAMEAKKERLKKYTSHVYGWDVVENDDLIPNWIEQDRIAMMKTWYNELGNYSAVSRKVNSNGWLGKRGGVWTSNLVKRCITNDLHEKAVIFTRPESVVPSEEPETKEERVCKVCGATETSQWRDTKHKDGPTCNKCHMRKLREQRKESKAPYTPKSRNEQINSTLKRHRGKSKKSKSPKKEVVISTPVVEVTLSEDLFVDWCKGNLSSMILRDKAFLIGTKVLETWFTTLKPQEEFISWLSENQETYMSKLKETFTKYATVHPTVFSFQDAGENAVLLINLPNRLNVQMLERVWA